MASERFIKRLYIEAEKRGIAHWKQAAAMNIAPSVFSSILCRRTIPSRTEIEALTKYYGVPGEELLGAVYKMAMEA